MSSGAIREYLCVDQLCVHYQPLLDAGRLAPVMDSTFALADAREAHARMESSEHIGKIVLKI